MRVCALTRGETRGSGQSTTTRRARTRAVRSRVARARRVRSGSGGSRKSCERDNKFPRSREHRRTRAPARDDGVGPHRRARRHRGGMHAGLDHRHAHGGRQPSVGSANGCVRERKVYVSAALARRITDVEGGRFNSPDWILIRRWAVFNHRFASLSASARKHTR